MRVLVDTSIWIDLLVQGDPQLSGLLSSNRAVIHPMTIGEIAVGSVRHRRRTLATLLKLPRSAVVTEDEVLSMVDDHGLHGIGLGYVDVHLLASARLRAAPVLWTRDRRLGEAARRLGVMASPDTID